MVGSWNPVRFFSGSAPDFSTNNILWVSKVLKRKNRPTNF